MTENQRKPVIRFAEFTDAWEQRKLGDVLKYEQPQTYIVGSTEYSDKYEIPVLTAGQSFILGYTDETIGIKNASVEQPVIIFDDFTTSSHYVDFPFKVKSSAMKILTLENNDNNIIFIFNVLQNIKYIPVSHERHWISTFSKFEFAKPSDVEQQKIGTYFKELNNLITLHQREYDKIVNLKKAMLEKMFPKNGEDRPEIRFKGFTDAWEQRKLGDISKIKTGSSDAQDAALEGEYPFFVRSDEIQHSNKYLYDGEAILIPGEGRLGEIYHYINGKFDFHQRVYKISDFDDTNGRFILYEMQRSFKHHALKNTAKATVDSIRLPTLTEYEMQIPSIEEQGLIGTYFKHLDNVITLHQRELKKLQNMKKALLEKMFVQG